MSWSDAIARANAALDWIEQRDGPLKSDGYARVEATVAEVRAWGQAMSDDARISEIADHWYSGERAREDVRYLLARVDALEVERDGLRGWQNGQTHYVGCWREHRQCALTTIDFEGARRERAELALREAVAELNRLREGQEP